MIEGERPVVEKELMPSPKLCFTGGQVTWGKYKKLGQVTKAEHDIIHRLAGAELCITPGCARPARVVNACNPERENVITKRCKDHETFAGRGEDRNTVLEKQNPLLNNDTRPRCVHPECDRVCVPDSSLTRGFRALCYAHDKAMRETNPLVGKAILKYEENVAEGKGICEFVDGKGRKCKKHKKVRKSRAKGGDGEEYFEMKYCDHHRQDKHYKAHKGEEGMPQVYWLFD